MTSRPKTLCYCTGGAVRTIGFPTYAGDPVELQCAIPTTVTPEGELSVVDFGCRDFEILAR